MQYCSPFFFMLKTQRFVCIVAWVIGTKLGANAIDSYHLKLVEPAGTPTGDFGSAVGVWRNFVFVGSPQYAALSGTVHVYDSSDGSLIRSLRPDPHVGSSGFGHSLAVSKDKLLVGAWREQAAYLFDLPSFALIRKFVPAQVGDAQRFAWAVDLDGDRALVGAYAGMANGVQSGTAYLFDIDSGRQIAKLDPPAGKDDDRFGWAVDITGPWISIGAWGEDASTQATFTGAVYSYRADTGSFAYKIPSGPAFSTSFGISVAGSGDRLIIGASRDDSSGPDAGAIHLGETGRDLPLQKIVPDDASVGFFGRVVAAHGARALVGADFTRNDGIAAAGRAYLVDLFGGTTLASYRIEDAKPYDRFGTAVALSDRFAVVACPKSDFRAQGVDAVYVFVMPPRLRVGLDGPLVLNRQTGLFEQRVTISNIGYNDLRGFRLQVSDLPVGVTFQNRATAEDTIDYLGTIPSQGIVSLILEFYSPARIASFQPQVSASEIALRSPLPIEPDGLAVDRCLLQDDGSFLIEFTAKPGSRYEIQYSDDGKRWRCSPVSIRAAGNRIQWIDRGPPRTETAPLTTPRRFYVVKELAE
jgi:hypothetical protein